MFDGYRVVCVTPAGRRRYMKLLAPLVLACDLVDRYDIWVNTSDAGDLAFFEGLARLDDRVRLVPRRMRSRNIRCSCTAKPASSQPIGSMQAVPTKRDDLILPQLCSRLLHSALLMMSGITRK